MRKAHHPGQRLVEVLEQRIAPATLTFIDVDGDTATGRWYLQDKVIVPEYSFMLEGAAFYDDRYVRTAEGWRVAHTGYRRTFEMTYNLADLPGVAVKGPGEHTHV